MPEQYPAMEQHGGAHYALQDVMQYGPPEGQFGAQQYQAPPYPVQNYAPPPPVYQYPSPYPEQYQESYVLTQLTEPSKPNYPVQTFPIHEPPYSQPEFPRMFPEEAPKSQGDVKKETTDPAAPTPLDKE